MLKLIPTKDDIITKLKIENDDCKALNIELKNKLTKYKRAFEILKDTVEKSFDFNIFCREVKKGDGVEKTYFIIFGEVWIKIAKEEYELLEELMKGE